MNSKMKKFKVPQLWFGEVETSLITHQLWPSGHKKGCYLKLFYSLHFKSWNTEKQQDNYNEERVKQEQIVRDCSLVKRSLFLFQMQCYLNSLYWSCSVWNL